MNTAFTHKNQVKSNGYGKGTFIESSMYLSEAFLSLNQRSRKTTQVLLLFLGKRQFGSMKDKGVMKKYRKDGNRLVLTYAEAESLGITRNVFIRAIDELLEKGFIEIVNPGGAYKRDKTVYALVDDYLFWRPDQEPIRTRKRDVKRGFQGAVKGAVVKSLHTSAAPIPKTQKTRRA